MRLAEPTGGVVLSTASAAATASDAWGWLAHDPAVRAALVGLCVSVAWQFTVAAGRKLVAWGKLFLAMRKGPSDE